MCYYNLIFFFFVCFVLLNTYVCFHCHALMHLNYGWTFCCFVLDVADVRRDIILNVVIIFYNDFKKFAIKNEIIKLFIIHKNHLIHTFRMFLFPSSSLIFSLSQINRIKRDILFIHYHHLKSADELLIHLMQMP